MTTYILTPTEGANFVRTENTDAVMLQLLPLVDAYLSNATGHDWASDAVINDTAKIAAGMLLVYWYDNPGAVGVSPETVTGALVQLEAEALKYRKYEFAGRNGAGVIALPGARVGDVVITLTGVYGVDGDQSAAFEDIVSVADQLQQTSASDLSDHRYVVVVKNPADDVSA
jgi:hypothetical protein